MKKIECIIRPDKLKELTEALREVGVTGATVTEVKGFGRNATRPDNYLYLPKTKVEIYATSEAAPEIVSAIETCCREEASAGSGKIIVLDMEECVRIRTGERGEAAII